MRSHIVLTILGCIKKKTQLRKEKKEKKRINIGHYTALIIVLLGYY